MKKLYVPIEIDYDNTISMVGWDRHPEATGNEEMILQLKDKAWSHPEIYDSRVMQIMENALTFAFDHNLDDGKYTEERHQRITELINYIADTIILVMITDHDSKCAEDFNYWISEHVGDLAFYLLDNNFISVTSDEEETKVVTKILTEICGIAAKIMESDKSQYEIIMDPKHRNNLN